MTDLRGADIAAGLERMGRAVLAFVTLVRGSTPREAGAAMLIGAEGALGTIGGGTAEHRAVSAARALLAEAAPAPETLDFPLGPELDQCCGGAMVVALAPLTAADAPRFATGGAALWPGGPIWREGPAPRPVLIYGAGHVGAAVVRALAPLPFALRWVDAREGLTAEAPRGVATVETPLPEAEAGAAPAGALHLVITHSHALDLEIVASALRNDPGFVGLIGSATKRATFLRRLRARGLTEAALARLTCPIGLPGLRDKRPAVIAASVAAQLLQVDAALAAQRRGAA
ncbi:MAG: xanthine dehydrogenase accessory protein XdhC [Rubrimonas sp.]|uniref:xanthine dehydrogenase accessory protein XdhC n=1 Tax=Rubrimonas sp. TaxID=2036015 RepID=UPI002FDD0CF3